MSKPTSFISYPEAMFSDGQPENGYCGVVDRVHDGDTFMCYLGLFRLELFPYVAIRIAGYYAPELWNPGGKDALIRASSILKRDTPIKVKIINKSFNRLVGKVTLDSGEDLGGVLAALGPKQTLSEGEDLPRAKLADHFPIPPILKDPTSIKMILHSRSKDNAAFEEASRRG